jgi:hypothetical protein
MHMHVQAADDIGTAGASHAPQLQALHTFSIKWLCCSAQPAAAAVPDGEHVIDDVGFCHWPASAQNTELM